MNSLPEDVTGSVASLEKYMRLFYATPDYVTFSNLKTGVLIDDDPGFEKMTGYRREDVIGKSVGALNLWVNPEERIKIIALLEKSNEVRLISNSLRMRNGEIRLCESSLASFEVQGEQLLVAVVRDVTARRREEQELERYRTNLEKLVEQRTLELEKAMQLAADLAVQDDLTGVGNRRDFSNKLALERQLYERADLPFCIAVLDLDHFKKINDTHGHAMGDAVIKRFAEIVSQAMRVTDYLARYGGDEFVLLLRATDIDAAAWPLQRISKLVSDYPWNTMHPEISLTTSIGVSAVRKGDSVEDTFNRADTALYRAKVSGRNKIEFFEGTTLAQ